MNAPTKVTEGGQVTLPQEVLDTLGIGPGSEVTFRRTADGTVTMERVRAKALPPERLHELRGHAGLGLTTDEIMEMTRGD